MEKKAEALSGNWFIKGTTFPLWLSGKRRQPMISYKLLSVDPLVFLDTVCYKNQQGKSKTIIGKDTWKQNTFVWRGAGILKVLSSRWSILALTETILVIKFERSFLTPAGIDVLVKESAQINEIKQVIADSPQRYGLDLDEVERLAWL